MIRVMMLVVLLVGLSASRPITAGYEIGDIATDFKLKNVDGKIVSLRDYKDVKGFIVVFDCNTCPYSKAYNSRIIELNDKYASRGFPLLAINSSDPSAAGESVEEMARIAKKKGYLFPYLIDETQQLAKTYGATNTPHVFVLSRNGQELRVAYIGTIDDNPRDAAHVSKKYVEDAVDALLTGKEIQIKKTRAIGCSIKWKSA